MVSQRTAESVEERDEYYHVHFRAPDAFETLRTPEWTVDSAESVLKGSEVRMGLDGSEWVTQSVLVPADRVEDEEGASRRALTIVNKVTD